MGRKIRTEFQTLQISRLRRKTGSENPSRIPPDISKPSEKGIGNMNSDGIPIGKASEKENRVRNSRNSRKNHRRRAARLALAWDPPPLAENRRLLRGVGRGRRASGVGRVLDCSRAVMTAQPVFNHYGYQLTDD
jgi:hypothetical protein